MNLAVQLAYETYSKYAYPPLLVLWYQTDTYLTLRSLYKEALKHGFYNLLAVRDSYRDAVALEGGMHVDLAMRFIKIQALLLAPIAPHVAEYLWSDILEQPLSIQLAQFPVISAPVDQAVIDSGIYLRTTVKTIRDLEIGHQKRQSRGKYAVGFDLTKPVAVRVFTAAAFPEWQEKCVAIVKEAWTNETGVDDAKVREALAKAGLIKDKRTMPFCAQLKVCRHLIAYSRWYL